MNNKQKSTNNSKAGTSSTMENPLSRRNVIRGSLTLGGAFALSACANGEDSGASGSVGDSGSVGSSSCEISVDPSYDGGQRLYRRNDGGENAGTNNPVDAISEGQTYGDMIIKSSAMYQTHGHMSHMETSVAAKTIIAPHVHLEADQLVIILGVVDGATASDGDDDEATTTYEVDPRYSPKGSPPSLMFQFDPQDDGAASEIIECPVGSYVLKPRGVSHTFWNPTNERITYCEISTGTDFEIFVRGSEDIETMADLEALEDASNTYFEDVNVLARLMFENLIPNVKGMGGLHDVLAELVAAIEALAQEKGVPVPPELFDITIE